MQTPKFVFDRLVYIYQNHPEYFGINDYNIFGCIEIIWQPPVSIVVIEDSMPVEIRHEIETMFWVAE